MLLIINEYKLYEDYEISYMQFPTWLNKVLQAIDRNEKIVVPMTSNNKAKDFVRSWNFKQNQKAAFEGYDKNMYSHCI